MLFDETKDPQVGSLSPLQDNPEAVPSNKALPPVHFSDQPTASGSGFPGLPIK